MGLGYELLLLAADTRGGEPRFKPAPAYSLAAAELIELALDARIELRGDRLAVVDSIDGRVIDGAADSTASTAEPVREALKKIVDAPQPVTLAQFLSGRGPWLIEPYVKALAELGVIGARERSAGSSEPAIVLTILRPERCTEAEARLLSVCGSDETPSIEDWAFAALCHVSGCADAQLQGWSHRRDRARIAELAKAVPSVYEPTMQLLQACIVEIRRLAAQHRRDSGDNRTMDERMGLTREAYRAATYWGL